MEEMPSLQVWVMTEACWLSVFANKSLRKIVLHLTCMCTVGLPC